MVETVHLPQLLSRDDCDVVILVDRDRARVSQLARQYGVRRSSVDYRDVLGSDVDAVLVALPNYLHAPVTAELLKAGLHVLVEKPMAPTVSECDAMACAAEEGRAILAVGLMRRFSHAGRFTKWAIEAGLLGTIRSFAIRDGFVYAWPVASDAFLRKEASGGGVLMDLGVHSLDQMLWWLGDVQAFEYYDDNYGGVEADCELRVTLRSGAHGTVECSRTRNIGQTAVIRGDAAELEVSLVENVITLSFEAGGHRLLGHAIGGTADDPRQRIRDLVAAQHGDFFDAIRLGRRPAVPGTEGRKAVALIQACYESRLPLRLPWVEPDAPRPPSVLLR